MPDASGAAVSSTGDSPAKSRFRWWHGAVLLVLVVVTCVLALRWHWKAGYRRRLEAIAAAGYPATPEELDAWYQWPASGDNAADWILDAGARLVKPSDKDYRQLRELGRSPGKYASREPLPEQLGELLVQHIEANTEALELLHQAATVQESRYPIDLSDGFETLMPHVSVYRDAHDLLCLNALLRIERDDSDGTIRAIEDALGIAHSLDAEPILLSQMLRIDSQRVALEILERFLCRQAVTEAQLTRLEALVRGADAPQAVRRAFIAEQCVFNKLFELPEFVDPGSFGKSLPPALVEAYAALGLAARAGISYLDAMDACLQVIRLPTHRRPEAVQAVEKKLRTASARNLMLPGVHWAGRTIIREIEGMARLRSAATALAIERFRLGTGHWPQTLAELVPDFLPRLLEDPFDGAPLRYTRRGQGFVVYSVGLNGVDDGGQSGPVLAPGALHETHDITFTVQR